LDASFKRPQEICIKHGATIRRRQLIILIVLIFSFIMVKGVVAETSNKDKKPLSKQ
jgi:hypothetical protein